MTRVTVVIAGRARASRAACRSLLDRHKDIRVVGEAGSGLETASAAEKLKPSVLLLDMSLMDGDVTALLAVLGRKTPRTRVLLLVGGAPKPRVLDALSHGARGYLEPRTMRTFLPRAVRAVNAGEAWVSRKMVAKIMDRLARLTIAA